MSMLNEALHKVMFNETPVLIKCYGEKNQESTRIMLYHLKKKLLTPVQAENIGISKFSAPDGTLFVKLYIRPKVELYEFNKEGDIVLMKVKPEDNPRMLAVINMMRKDGKTEEEIKEVIDTWDDEAYSFKIIEETDEELVEKFKKENADRSRLMEKEEMRRIKEEK